MAWASPTPALLFAALLAVGPVHAQSSADSGGEESTAPEPVAQPATPDTREDDTTWFGMGFESRQDRFRREMGLSGPGGANGGSGGGAGGGRGRAP